jgi:hypothetical protein
MDRKSDGNFIPQSGKLLMLSFSGPEVSILILNAQRKCLLREVEVDDLSKESHSWKIML